MRWWEICLVLVLAVVITPSAAQTSEQCDRLDLVFIVDSSGSICDDDPTDFKGPDGRICRNWEFVREFMSNIVERVQIGPRFVHVALVTFGNRGIMEWDLSEYMEKDTLQVALLNLVYRSQNTNTSGGLKAAIDQVFTPSGGDRPNVGNVAIVITDGKSTRDPLLTLPTAKRLREEKDVIIFSVGITRDIDEDELKGMSSEPQQLDKNYFKSATFADLGTILDTLVNQTCESQPPTPTECSNEVDLLFILDGSDFVDLDYGTYTEWDAVITFVMNLVIKWGVLGDGGANVGIIVYGDDVTMQVTLGDETDIDALLMTIHNLKSSFPGGEANLREALEMARDQVFTKTGGDREGVPDLIVLIAGGESTRSVGGVTDDLKDGEVAVFVIGSTTDISEASLKSISSGPQDINKQYWLLLTFDSLDSIVLSVSPEIVEHVCQGLPRGPEVPTDPVPLDCQMDIAIIVDASGSIKDANPEDNSYDNWAVIKTFLMDFAEYMAQLAPAGGETRLAIIRYSTQAHVDIYFDQYIGDPEGLRQAIEEIGYDGHWTNTPAALDLARTDVFVASRGNRPKAVDVAVVLTDGKPEIQKGSFLVQETLEAARKLKGHGSRGVKVYAIGVTTEAVENPVSDETLKGMSSEPQLINQNYWTRPDFRSLTSLLQDLSRDACDPPANPCTADLVFVLDYSSSIGTHKYNYVRDFVSSFVTDMDLADKSRVGVVLFSDTDHLGFMLNEYTDREEASQAVLDLEYVGGRTNTGAALDYVREEMFKEANGDRPEVANIVIVITDGGSNRPDKGTVIEAAKEVKKAGIHVVAVGIGGWIDKYEMYAIGSYPRDINTILVPKIEDLVGHKGDLEALICNKVNECSDDLCENDGECEDGFGTYWCRCPDGFAGQNCEGVCRNPADVTFALDSSGSVGLENFQKETDFVASVIFGLNTKGNMCRVATQQYADESAVKSYLNEYDARDRILHGFNFYYEAGSTNTGDAIQQMRNDIFTEDNGDRDDVENIGVVLTDGRSDDAMETWLQAMENREEGISMVAVGVGSNLRPNELEGIASSPVEGNVLLVDDFNSIADARQTLIDTICNNVDDCNPSPCRNGGECEDMRNGYTCKCPSEVTGNFCERECSGEIDLIFVLDASGSVRSKRFLKVIDFAIAITKELEFGEDKVRVGAIKFSDDAEVQFNLNEYSARQDVVSAMRRITYMRQRTHTAEALQTMVEDMFTKDAGDRDNARNVAIIITNANSNINKEDTIPRAIDAKNAGVHMIAVGVGDDVDVLELNGLASRPSSENVFLAKSQNNLPGLIAGLVNSFCNDEDDCDSDPCDRGACGDDFSQYTCDCQDDWTGQNCDRECTAQIDLVLVLDLSGSVDVVTNIITAFCERLVQGVNMAFQRTRVGIVIFSDESETWVELDTYSDKLAVLNTLTFPRAGGKTNTQSALRRLRTSVYTRGGGDRSGVDNKAVVFTDGYSNIDKDETLPQAEDCRDDDIELFVVAIGRNPGMNEINGIASDPDSDHVFKVQDSDDVNSEADRLLDALCE